MIRFWARASNRSWLRGAGGILAASLLFSISAPPFAQASLWQERRQAQASAVRPSSSQTAPLSAGLSPDLLAHPWGPSEDIGSIVETWQAPRDSGQPMIIQIEDAHGVYGAQKNSASLLQWLASESPKSEPLLVFVEGAWGPVDPSWAAALPDADERRQSAEDLLRQGRITA